MSLLLFSMTNALYRCLCDTMRTLSSLVSSAFVLRASVVHAAVSTNSTATTSLQPSAMLRAVLRLTVASRLHTCQVFQIGNHGWVLPLRAQLWAVQAGTPGPVHVVVVTTGGQSSTDVTFKLLAARRSAMPF